MHSALYKTVKPHILTFPSLVCKPLQRCLEAPDLCEITFIYLPSSFACGIHWKSYLSSDPSLHSSKGTQPSSWQHQMVEAAETLYIILQCIEGGWSGWASRVTQISRVDVKTRSHKLTYETCQCQDAKQGIYAQGAKHLGRLDLFGFLIHDSHSKILIYGFFVVT